MLLGRPLEIRRLIVFGTVGTLNTAACYAFFAALVHLAGWHYNLALVVDYLVGTLLGYALHSLATFGDRKHVKQAFGKYTATLAVTFLLNFALLDAIVTTGLLDPLRAQAVAMALATLASYRLQKHWVFRSHPPAEIQHQPAIDNDPAPAHIAA
jgi:putative flippase GtrA